MQAEANKRAQSSKYDGINASLMSLIGMMFVFNNWIGSSLSFLLAFTLGILELLVAALQAYIFTMLSAVYFGSAVAEHEHDEEH